MFVEGGNISGGARELATLLEEFTEDGKRVSIQVCPRCKSTRIRRTRSGTGDMSGHLGWTPPKFECPECGWRGRLAIYATNRPLDKKQVAVINYALDSGSKTKGDGLR